MARMGPDFAVFFSVPCSPYAKHALRGTGKPKTQTHGAHSTTDAMLGKELIRGHTDS